MQKKKFDLTSDIVNVNLDEAKADKGLIHQVAKSGIITNNKKSVLITISVDTELRKEYKTWCAKNGIKMNEAFLMGFELLKKTGHSSSY